MEYTGMVVDTSVFIEYLRIKDKTQSLLLKIPENCDLFVSTVTIFELYCGATDAEKQNDIRLLTEDLIVLPFSQEIAKKTAETYQQLKSQNKLIEFRDLFIGCTALSSELPLLTTNKKHFERIPDLVLVDL